MSKIELTAPCNFGVEAVLNREIKSLGYEISKTVDGRVSFIGDELAICRSNLWLRTAERVFVKLGEFEARSFEELFQATKKLPWSDWLPVDAAFPVSKVSSLKSALFSPSDIQSIMKKAIVENMREKYKQDWFEETGTCYTIYVLINKDLVSVYFDTSGESLHKRGYRGNKNLAPIKETLAATMVDLTPWREDRLLIDPLCGSGTIVIEAALKGLNIAPGIKRGFAAETWGNIPAKLWQEARTEAKDLERKDVKFLVQGYDIDYHSIKMAKENAALAGVSDFVHFQERDVKDLSSSGKYGFIVTNPPYGERMEDRDSVTALYKSMKQSFKKLDTWSYSIITSYPNFETLWGKTADKRRKLYNGMLQTTLYQYFGPRPPRREPKAE